MLRHKNIDRICCIVLVLTLLLGGVYVGAAASGSLTANTALGYETRLFDQSRVHTIDIVMQDWDAFLSTCTSEEYTACHLVIDGESYKNVAIRAKGNTSLSSVAAYGNDRYSFKVEFDHYQTGKTYHGLDKLCLNNIIQDNTYMKDYFAYTLMSKMGVASPLCSFVQINVNGESWGLYLAVEGVEEGFLQRNYGRNYGELYKPDSLSFGGGRGNGRDFNMEDAAEQFGFSFGGDGEDPSSTIPEMPMDFDPSQMMGSFGGSSGQSATAAPTAPAQEDTSFGDSSGQSATAAPAAPTQEDASFGGSSGMPAMPNGDMPAMPDGFEPNIATSDAQVVPDFSSFGGAGGFGGGFGSSADVKLQYIDDDPDSYSNIFNNAKTDVSAKDKARLIASLKSLSVGDASVVDQDAVLRYMAVHNFLCNDDSYTGMMVHNYYLYEKDGVLAMIPWDYNLAYGTMTGSNATSTVNTTISRLVSSGSDSDRPMAGWITASDTHTAEYYAVYREFIAEVFDSDWFSQEIDRVTAMIAPYVESDPTAFCTYAEFQTAADTLKAFCLKRAESVTRQLGGDDTQVDASDLDLSAMGTMNGTKGGGRSADGTDKRQKGGRGERNQRTDSISAPEAASSPAPASDAVPSAVVMPSRPDFSSGSTDTSMPRTNGNARLIWLMGCVLLLAAALIFAKRFKSNR